MGIGYTSIGKWVRQLREERQGKTPQATPMTDEQREIRELKKQFERLEQDKFACCLTVRDCWVQN